MAAQGDYTYYDQYLHLLAQAQRYKLRVNRHKGNIGDVPVARLLDLLRDEVNELEEAASRANTIEMILEAADVANFALGIAIAAIRQGTTPNVSPSDTGHELHPAVARCADGSTPDPD